MFNYAFLDVYYGNAHVSLKTSTTTCIGFLGSSKAKFLYVTSLP